MTLKLDRFAPLSDPKGRPSVVQVAETGTWPPARRVNRKDSAIRSQKLPDGQAERTESDGGTPLVATASSTPSWCASLNPDLPVERPARTSDLGARRQRRHRLLAETQRATEHR